MSGAHEEWFAKAENDLKFAELGLKEGFCAQVCFLSQQAIEKALKGVMVALGRSYPKSHNLLELSKKLPELDLAKHLPEIAIIDGYYVPLRYPDAAPGMKASGEPSNEEAARALACARGVFNAATEFVVNTGRSK